MLEVNARGFNREVSVRPDGDHIRGTIGSNGVFSWDLSKYELPFIKINGNPISDRKIKLIAVEFIRAYINAVGVVKSPMHFDSSKSFTYSSSSKSELPSGVPKWMLESCKIWSACFHRVGPHAGQVAYLRRTRFSQDKRDIVEKYLPNCSKCPLRVECLKPCYNPDQKSQTRI
jgi:hypothetical protein